MDEDWALFRIDDRLLHGQVVTVWIATLRVNTILLIDDVVSKDGFLQQIYKLSAPPGITIDICSIIESSLYADKYASRKSVMVLVRSPAVTRTLFENGFPIKHVNIGALGSTPERRLFYKNFSLSEKEIDSLRAMQASGLRIYFQRTPEEIQKIFGSA